MKGAVLVLSMCDLWRRSGDDGRQPPGGAAKPAARTRHMPTATGQEGHGFGSRLGRKRKEERKKKKRFSVTQPSPMQQQEQQQGAG